MRIGLGIVTLAASVAALTAWFAPQTVDDSLAIVTDVGTDRQARLSAPVAPETVPSGPGRFFGTGLGSSAPVTPAPADVASRALPTATPKAGWSTDVIVYATAEEAGTAPASPPPARVITASAVTPTSDSTSQQLVRDIQRELKRVGCYVGEIDGEWGPASRRALRTFVDRVSSRLQTDAPDLIQLTLVRGYPGIACRSLQPPANGAMTATRTTPPAGPAIAATPPPFAPSAPTFAAAAPAGPGSVVTGSLAGTPATAARPAVFEGRMTVGAPMPAAEDGSAVPGQAEPPPAIGAPPRPSRPRPVSQAQRRDRNWTATFFNQ
jgi:hypothetical protein